MYIAWGTMGRLVKARGVDGLCVQAQCNPRPPQTTGFGPDQAQNVFGAMGCGRVMRIGGCPEIADQSQPDRAPTTLPVLGVGAQCSSKTARGISTIPGVVIESWIHLAWPGSMINTMLTGVASAMQYGRGWLSSCLCDLKVIGQSAMHEGWSGNALLIGWPGASFQW